MSETHKQILPSAFFFLFLLACSIDSPLQLCSIVWILSWVLEFWVGSRIERCLRLGRLDLTLRGAFVAMKEMPIAVNTEDANAQHYEVPTEFYQLVLGKRLKYRYE